MRLPAEDASKASPLVFPLGVDATRVWLSSRDREVLMIMDTAIQQGQRVLLLTGEMGTGKTVLSRVLVEGLAETGVRVGWLPSPDLEPRDFYAILAEGFPEHLAAGDDFLGAFRHFLGEVRGRGQWLLLVIDDAHALRPALFAELLRLLDVDQHVNRGQAGVLKILLVGRSSLATTLKNPEYLAVAKLIGVGCTLRPLTATEVGEYVRHHLAAVGLDPGCFTPEAMEEIVTLSGGRPRMINVVCDRALRASLSGAKTVDAALVRRRGETATPDTLSGLQRPPATGREHRAKRKNVVARKPTRGWTVVGVASAAALGVFLAFGVLLYLAGAFPSRMTTVLGSSRTVELPEPRLETIRPVRADVPLVDGAEDERPEPAGTTPTRPTDDGLGTAPSVGETTPRVKPAEPPAAAVSAVTTVPRPRVPPTVRSDRASASEKESLESPSTAPGLLRGTRTNVKAQARTTTADEPEPSAIIDWLVKEGPRLRD